MRAGSDPEMSFLALCYGPASEPQGGGWQEKPFPKGSQRELCLQIGRNEHFPISRWKRLWLWLLS